MSVRNEGNADAPKGIGQPGDEPVNESRRRWVIGALAGPAAFSLPARASAAAMGSLSICTENQYSNTNIPLHMVPPLDQYARKPVQGIEVQTPNGKESAFLVSYSGQYYDQFWRKWYLSGKNYMSPYGDPFKYYADQQRYTLMFMDGSTYTGTDPSSGFAITTSCYLSVYPVVM